MATMVQASQKYGRAWHVAGVRQAKQGELVYLGSYDRILPAPNDDPYGVCSVIVGFGAESLWSVIVRRVKSWLARSLSRP